MQTRLTPSTVLLLLMPPLLWAGNAIVGRMVYTLTPPMTFNLLRWVVAFAVLLPLAWRVLKADSPLWPRWRYYALLGLLGVGCYNSLQYMALKTSLPLNTTLVASGMPLWMLLVGRLFFRQPVRRTALLGALLSMAGVLVVLSRGSFAALAALHLVPGDGLMVLATISWSFYSWMLVSPARKSDPLTGDWSGFLIAQVFFGLLWSGAFTAVEWGVGDPHIDWGWPLLAAVLFVGTLPAVLAYRCFGAGVQRAGPTLAAFFINLTPVFTGLMSALLLHESPKLYHAVAFALIVAGIVVSSRKRMGTG